MRKTYERRKLELLADKFGYVLERYRNYYYLMQKDTEQVVICQTLNDVRTELEGMVLKKIESVFG